MNEKEFNFKIKIIRDTFNDKRPIKCETPEEIRSLDENIHQGGDIFTTEDGDFIDLEFQMEDFDEEELTKYIEFAENFYEKNNGHVSVYLICSKNINVLVNPCKIFSESEFTIKLACSQEDPCKIILDEVKNKIRMNEPLNEYDLLNVSKLPVMCAKKDRRYYRLESLKIINRISY